MKRTILALLLLTCAFWSWSWAQPVYEAVSKCLVIHLQEGIPSLKIQLSDDYTVARKADIKGNLMLCPWNEYFIFETSSVDLNSTAHELENSSASLPSHRRRLVSA